MTDREAIVAAWNAADPSASYADVAASLGMKRSTFATNLSRARQMGLEVRRAKRSPKTERAKQRRSEDVLEQWDVWRGDGATVEEAAEALGMKFKTFQRVLNRARAAGDDRGRYNVMRRRKRPVVRPKFAARIKAWNEADPALTVEEFAASIGVKRDALASMLSRARREGVEVRPATSRSDSVVAQEWRFLREAGTSIEEAAQRLGVDVETLRRVV